MCVCMYACMYVCMYAYTMVFRWLYARGRAKFSRGRRSRANASARGHMASLI